MVCTANVCRSPLAAALLSRHARDSELTWIEVRSAGFRPGGAPAPAIEIEVAAAHGLDLSGHRSRRVDVHALTWADLVLTMEARHVRDAALSAPEVWGRTFTLQDFVRRAEAAPGPETESNRRDDIPSLVRTVGQLRTRREVLARGAMDDIEDPIGGSRAAYEAAYVKLDDLTRRVVDAVATVREHP